MTELRRQVADLVEAAKIRWIEKKVGEMENKYDPRGAWRAMREISAMFAGHIKSAVTMRMRKKDGTIATTDEENGRVLFPTTFTIAIFVFMLLIFVLTDASYATYSILLNLVRTVHFMIDRFKLFSGQTTPPLR